MIALVSVIALQDGADAKLVMKVQIVQRSDPLDCQSM